MFTKNPFSDLVSKIAQLGDLIPGLQKQSDGSFKNVLFSASPSPGGILLAKQTLNFNSTNDQKITLAGGTKFIITEILFQNPSIDMTQASNGEFWVGANRSGDQLFYGTTSTNGFDAIQALKGAGYFLSMRQLIDWVYGGYFQTFLAMPTQKILTSADFYFSLGAAQGAAATCEVLVFGQIIE